MFFTPSYALSYAYESGNVYWFYLAGLCSYEEYVKLGGYPEI